MTRKEKAGIMMADSLIEWVHMIYNHNTAKGVENKLTKVRGK